MSRNRPQHGFWGGSRYPSESTGFGQSFRPPVRVPELLLIPVIDLRGGLAVHAVGGRRSKYRPVVSPLTASTDPADLALAMNEHCRSGVVYVADLDAILDTGSNAVVVARIADRVPGVVLCDAGLRTAADRDRLADRSNIIPIWASETVLGPAELLCSPPAVFSVDTHAGRLIGPWHAWGDDGVTSADDVVTMAVAGQRRTGAKLVILLDLHSVGRGEGPAALAHVPAVRAALPAGVKLAVGGGVRDRQDVARLADAGADAALVATAVHAGTV